MKHSFPQSVASLLAGGPRCAASVLADWGSIPLAEGLLGEVKGTMKSARLESLTPNQGGGADHKSASPLAFGAKLESRPFWRLIDSSAGPRACWPWTGFRDKDGYGTHAKGRRANRVACEAGHGPPPFKGAKALHSCDNPPCCNPAHLSWGTQKRNYDESVERGRHINAQPRRERGYASKLTEAQVREIVAIGHAEPYETTGARFGVTGKQVANIVKGKRWTHLSRAEVRS